MEEAKIILKVLGWIIEALEIGASIIVWIFVYGYATAPTRNK